MDEKRRDVGQLSKAERAAVRSRRERDIERDEEAQARLQAQRPSASCEFRYT